MAVHNTIGTPPLNFYMPHAAETGEALSQEKKLRGGGTEDRWGIKRMSRFRKQFLRNISYLVEEE